MALKLPAYQNPDGMQRFYDAQMDAPTMFPFANGLYDLTTVGVRPCCVGSPLPDREKVVQTRLVSVLTLTVRCCVAVELHV